MSKIKAASTIAIMWIAMNSAWAKDAEELVRPHGLEHMSEDTLVIPQHLWSIIGAYTANSRDSEKFIKPAQDCELVKKLTDNYLLQLESCIEQRKGWLKI
tara:strand:- start:18 stop:317 length:300 start_codon:yes stop_codon:yes gene_type:complete